MNNRNFNKLYDELAEWMEGNDHDGGLEYAFNNDFQLHAVSQWESTGASKYKFSANISRRAEEKEIKALIESADIYICLDCNHHAFYQKGELDKTPRCMSCLGRNMKLDGGFQ